jgi:predicted TIM-barrel fold metal-dependent hydrolase
MNAMDRRSFLKNAALAAVAVSGQSGSRAEPAPAAAEGLLRSRLTDAHVYLSRWPFRRVPLDQTHLLVAQLKRYGVAQAWAGSFDALLHRDISAVNLRLAEECESAGAGILLPFGAVNPMLPDWEEDLRRCHEVHRMRGIRLHPDFHGYSLEHPVFRSLFAAAAGRGLIIQIALGMEDPRTQPPLARLAPTNPAPLLDLLPAFPQAKVVLLNFFRTFGTNRVLLIRLSSQPQITFDLAMVEGLMGVQTLLADIPTVKLLFGSYAPFYNFESSWLKLQESVLAPDRLKAIQTGNAAAVLG